MDNSIRESLELCAQDIRLMATQLDMMSTRLSMGDQISIDTISNHLKNNAQAIKQIIQLYDEERRVADENNTGTE